VDAELVAAGPHCNAVFTTETGTFLDPRNDRREWQTLLVRRVCDERAVIAHDRLLQR